jgi:hypothetical protein
MLGTKYLEARQALQRSKTSVKLPRYEENSSVCLRSRVRNAEVRGSIPLCSTKRFQDLRLLERVAVFVWIHLWTPTSGRTCWPGRAGRASHAASLRPSCALTAPLTWSRTTHAASRTAGPTIPDGSAASARPATRRYTTARMARPLTTGCKSASHGSSKVDEPCDLSIKTADSPSTFSGRLRPTPKHQFGARGGGSRRGRLQVKNLS